MDDDENKKENNPENNPSTSGGGADKPTNEPQHSSESDVSMYSDISAMSATLKLEKQRAPNLSKKSRGDKIKGQKKEKKKRNGGRVEKRVKRRGRYKRKTAVKERKVRAPSLSSEASEHPPRPCRYCGHRCCLERDESRESTRFENKKNRAQKAKKTLKTVQSACVQVGYRCKMLSPLLIKTNARLVDTQELEPPKTYCEITPDMIYDAVRELTMLREAVTSGEILNHLQSTFPVNPDVEELETELAYKLHLANLAGIIWALPNDSWRLPTGLEKNMKLEKGHVSVFWRIHADTLRPLPLTPNRKRRRPQSTGQSRTSSTTSSTFSTSII